jgi:hypothetical protein
MAAGVPRIHPLRDVFLLAHLDMEAQLGVDIAIQAPPHSSALSRS